LRVPDRLKLSGPDDRVIGLNILTGGAIVTATENGYGKVTAVDEFSRQGRGGQGVISIRTTERNGPVVGALEVAPGDEMMLITSAGTLVRTPVDEISVMGRNTQGVRLIRLDDGDHLVGIERIEALQDDEPDAEEE
jgi:DNA gyrase subunit A